MLKAMQDMAASFEDDVTQALIPFIDPGAQKQAKESDAECANLVRTLGVIPKAVRTPKSAPVPPAAASAASAAARAKLAAAASAPAR